MKQRSLNFTQFLGVKTLLITALCLFAGAVQSQTISPFITTWQTDASKIITIPLTGAGYDFSINWGDGVTETKIGTPNNISHTYATAGLYTVTITPNTLTGFPRIYVSNFGNRTLLKTVAQWGGGKWASMVNAFYGANTMDVTATDVPDLSNVTDFTLAFYDCAVLVNANGSMANWVFTTDPAKSINFSQMFQSALLFNQNISNWDVTRVVNMTNMFNTAQTFNQPLNWGAKTANVTSMNAMFIGAIKFNQDLSGWDVSSVTNMANMFYNANAFNSPLNWGAKTANVTNMTNMFTNTLKFNQDISGWDVSKVTLMTAMFNNAQAFNMPLSAWNVGSVTNMANMFQSTLLFNQDISNWNVANVITMNSMFYSAKVFNSPLNAWGIKTGKVTDMGQMFRDAPLFNQNINDWDVSKVTSTTLMFYRTNSFNQDLNSWDFSSLTNGSQMFQENSSFNGNITNWKFSTDPTKSINLSNMFNSTTKFNQNISTWNVSRVTSMNAMFISSIAFNQDLSAWDVSNVIDMGNMFNNAQAFNSPLNWGAKTAKVTNMSTMFTSSLKFNQDISGWDVSKVTNMGSMFQSAQVFNQNIGGWNVSTVTNMASMFYDARVFNQNISTWDVSNVTNMSSMFRQMPLFNQPLDAWGTKTGKVTTMQEMFRESPLFNQNINSWDVSKVTTTQLMFYRTNSFNQDLNSWDLSSLTNGTSMFLENTAFNGNIVNWKFATAAPTLINLSSMFQSTTLFNKDISTWNVVRVSNMGSMFYGTQAFNQDLSAWDVSNVTNMSYMFQNAQAFNLPLNWGAKTINVTNMANMFVSTLKFNQDINGWDVSNVTNMSNMFNSAQAFNLPLNNWNVGKVTNMANMFQSTQLFNQNISAWNVANVTTMNSMFYLAKAFNSPLNAWGIKTGKVTDMTSMFRETPLFNQNINDWDVSKVINASLMFYRTNGFNQDLNSWNFASLVNGSSMFQESTSFNGNIANWKFSTGTPAAVNLSSMFQSTTVFDKNLGAWNISFVTNLTNFLTGSKICRQNYDAILKGWSTLDAGETKVPTGININFGVSKYSNDAAVVAARSALVTGKTWVIADGGVESDYTSPTINGSVLAANNSTITITLSDRAYNSCKAINNLKITDFTFSIAGGVATLSSVNPTTITTTDNITFVLGLGFSVPANGSEILTVNPTASSIFDAAGNELGTPQSNNTAQLNDLTPPVISGPATATGASSSISVAENQNAVFSFTANESVVWSLGTSADKALFAISSTGVVTFNLSPDFEIPTDANTDNNYLIEVVATDVKGNISKQTVTITVTDVFDLPATLTNFNAQNKMFFDGSFTITPPTSNNSTGAFTYTSSNTSVATISGATVTLKGIGATTITATQAGDGYYTVASTSATLTVTSVDVVTKNGQSSNLNVNYVNANGSLGTTTGVDLNGQIKATKSLNTAGLVLWLDADNTSSYSGTGNTWYDLSGNNNDISWSAPAPEYVVDNGIKVIKTTNAAGALRAMVSTNYNNLPTGNQSYTAITFFKPNSTASAKIILSLGPANNLCGGTQIHTNGIGTGGKYAGGSCGGLGTWQGTAGVVPNTSAYVCVATTYGGTTENVYVNGTLDKTANMTTNIPVSADNKICIGWVRDDGANYNMDANIGLILFYNRELSASEITQIYQTYRKRFGIN